MGRRSEDDSPYRRAFETFPFFKEQSGLSLSGALPRYRGLVKSLLPNLLLEAPRFTGRLDQFFCGRFHF